MRRLRLPFLTVPCLLVAVLGPEAFSDGPAPNVRVGPAESSRGRLAVRGSRLVVAFADGTGSPSVSVSTDSGSTFSPPAALPVPAASGGPDVAFAPDGTLLAVSASTSPAGSPLLVRSADGGGTFQQAYAVYGSLIASDPRFTVDAGTSTRAGSVYLSGWDYPFDYYGGFVLGSSSDSGHSFGPPWLVCGDRQTATAVGPNGDVYVAYRYGYPATLHVVRSSDGGKSLDSPQAMNSAGTPGALADAGPVALAVGADGTVHVAYASVPAGSSGDRADVYYVRSTDGAKTFGPPVRLSDDTRGAGQTSPAVGVLPDGTVAVFWRDRRNDPLDDVLGDVYVAVSHDEGLTFGADRRVSDHTWFADRPALRPSGGEPLPSDAISVVAADGAFHVTWTDGDAGVTYARIAAGAPDDQPDFGVSVPSYAAVLAGRTLLLDVGTSVEHGFSGDVQLSATAPAGGPTPEFRAGVVAAGESTTLTLSAPAAAAPGRYIVKVAASSGTVSRSTDVRVDVYDPARVATVPMNLSSSRGDASVSAATPPSFDAAGALYVPYTDDSFVPSGLAVRTSRDGGRTFSGPAPLAGDQWTSYAASPSGALYAVRVGPTNVLTVSKSSDGGATFRDVFTNPTRGFAPFALACGPGGSVAVVWVSDVPPNTLFASISPDDGATFSAPMTIDSANDYFFGLSAAWAPGGSLWVLASHVAVAASGVSGYSPSDARLWAAAPGQAFKLAHTFASRESADGGDVPTSWASAVRVGADGAVWVGWLSALVAPQTGPVRATAIASSSRDGGATFTDVPVSPPAALAGNLFVAPDNLGGAVALWDALGEVWFARTVGGSGAFSDPVNLSANPGLSFNASAAADARGNVFVTWTDDSRGHPQVFASWLPASLAASGPSATIDEPASDLSVEADAALEFRGFGTGSFSLAPHWDFGDGATADSETVTHAWLSPGTFVVRFTVTDPVGRSASASRTVTVRLPDVTASDTEIVLPVVADTPGRNGARFTTDVTLVSRAPAPVIAFLEYTASDGRGSGVVPYRLEPGREQTIPDVVSFLRSQGLAIPADGSAGALHVVFRGARPGEAWAFARTTTPCGGGACGVSYAAPPVAEDSTSVVGLQESASFRSNLGLVNLGGEAIALRIALYGPSGDLLAELPDRTLPAFGWTQVDRPLLGLAEAGRAVVTRVSGSAPFSAYGVLIDETTSAGAFVAAVAASATDLDRLVPVVLDATGLEGAHYRTELTLANLTGASLPLVLTFTTSSAGSGSVGVVLGPGEQRIVPDAVAYLRAQGLAIPPGNAAGSLRVSGGAPATSFAALARTYSPGRAGGTYGVAYAGVTASESADSRAWVYGLREDAAARSNFALVNRGDSGDSIALTLTFFDDTGAPLGAPLAVALSPGEWRQIDRPLAVLGASAGFVRIDRAAGASRFIAYGVRNDAVTSDGSLLPMDVAP